MAKRLFLILTTLLSLSLALHVTTQAQTPPPDPNLQQQAVAYTGIDMVLLVDQSGSMGGARYGSMRSGEPGDPEGLRFQLQQYAMQWVSDYSFFAAAEPSTMRMSVINFGDPQITTILDWTELGPDTFTTEQQLDTQKADLGDLLSADHFGERNFNYTNFEQAIQMARQKFDAAPALPTGEQNIRLIIIVTDGEPCALADTDPEGNCTNTSLNQAQLTRTGAYISNNMSADSYAIYLVAVENPSQPYWSTYEQGWQGVLTNPARVINNASQMATEVDSILNEVLNRISNSRLTVPVTLDANGNGAVEMPPYVGQTTFNIFTSGGTQANPVITDGSGRVLSPTEADVTVEGSANIQRWSIVQPTPGTWQVSIPNDPTAQVSVNLNQDLLQADLPTQSVYQFQTLPLQPELYYKTGSTRLPVELYDAPYDLRMMVVVTDPNALTQESELLQSGTAPNREFVTGTFPAVHAGEYLIELYATTPNYAPDPSFTPLDTRGVAPDYPVTVNPVRVNVELPSGGDALETLPYEVCVQLQDLQGAILQADGFDSIDVFAVMTNTADGSELDALMVAAPDNPNCTFSGSITPTAPGNYTVTTRANVRNQAQDVFTGAASPPTERAVTVRALQRITLSIVDPNVPTSESPLRDTIPPWAKLPVSLEVVAVDQNNQIVDLASLLGGSPNPYGLTATRNGTPVTDVPLSLTSVSGGANYGFTTDELGRGLYTFNVTGQALDPSICACDYAPGGNTATVSITRVFPTAIYLQWGGIAIVLALLVIGGSIFAAYRDSITNDPIEGTISFFSESLQSRGERYDVGSVLLSGVYNRETFKGDQLGMLSNIGVQSIHAKGAGSSAIQVTIKLQDAKEKVEVRLTSGVERPISEMSSPDEDFFIIYYGKDDVDDPFDVYQTNVGVV